MSAAPWQSLHLYYFDKKKDALFLDCLRPLRDELARRGAEALFFERHWRGGPHVRIRFRAEDDAFRGELFPMIDAHVHAFLAVHPSRRVLDEATARAQHELLAAFELDAEPYTPLRADNSLELVPYAPSLQLYRAAAAVALMEDFSVASVPLLFDIVAASRDDQSARMAIAMRLLLAYADGLAGIERGYLFCRSYLEKYLGTGTPDPEAARAKFRAAYEARREAVQAIIAGTAADLASGAPSDPILAQWRALHGDYAARARTLIDAGVPLAWGPDSARELDTSIWTTKFWQHKTEYLERMYANDALRARMNGGAFHQTHMVLVNYLYRLLAAAGITGGEKFVLFALVAYGVEEAYGIEPLERVAERP